MNTSPHPRLHIHLLGDFRLSYGDEPVTSVKSARLQSLLAYLLLHRDAPQPRHHVAFLFWPDSLEAQALTNLRNLLHHLRNALPDADRFLHVDTQTLQWRPDAPFTLDVAAFESALARARQAEQRGDRTTLRKALEQAVALYKGDLLLSCYDDWIMPERQRLQQALTEALDKLSRLLEGARRYRAAIHHVQRMVQLDPLQEAAHRRLMRLQALSGDRAAALHAYHTWATVLQRELGLDPSSATREEYERLLQMNTSTAYGEGGAATSPGAAPASTAGRIATPRLVGRQKEWRQLRNVWRTASAGRPHVVVISGEEGIGKTRLAQELVEWAGRQGIATATTRCTAAEGRLAYAPVADWLRARPLPSLDPVWRTELSRLLPELLAEQPDLSPPGPLVEPWQRLRFFESLARAILGGHRPILLSLDGMQWCDRETLEFIRFLLQFDPQAPILIVGTYRPEDIEGERLLAPLLRDLRRTKQRGPETALTEIELEPLDADETVALVADIAAQEPDPDLAACLHRETEGNPLFIVETVRMGLAAQDRRPDSGEGALSEWRLSKSEGAPSEWRLSKEEGPWGTSCLPRPLPSRIQAAIEGRLAQLSPAARALVELAATIGHEFTFACLTQATDLDEATLVRALDELWRLRVICEQGADAYDFSHDKLREVAYAGLSHARRRLLHRRVAHALEAVYADDLDPVAAQVAAHYERAGEPEQAIQYYRRAAEVARQMQATEQANRYDQRASALL